MRRRRCTGLRVGGAEVARSELTTDSLDIHTGHGIEEGQRVRVARHSWRSSQERRRRGGGEEEEEEEEEESGGGVRRRSQEEEESGGRVRRRRSQEEESGGGGVRRRRRGGRKGGRISTGDALPGRRVVDIGQAGLRSEESLHALFILQEDLEVLRGHT